MINCDSSERRFQKQGFVITLIVGSARFHLLLLLLLSYNIIKNHLHRLTHAHILFAYSITKPI